MSRTPTIKQGDYSKINVKGKKVRVSAIPRARKTTHLSDKSTSKMSHNINRLNKKIMQYIGNQ